MSKSKQKQRARQQHHAKPRGRRKLFILIGFVLMVGIAVAVALLREAYRGFDALNGRGISKFLVSSRPTAVLDQGPIYTCGSICLF